MRKAVFSFSSSSLTCGIAALLALHVATLRSQVSTAEPALTAAEVSALLTQGAMAINSPALAVAVVDRGGRILGVLRRGGASANGPDIAVTTARAAAMFSNAEAPLSSRTVRFISGIHFPPGVANTGNAALYGIENTNRGCDLNASASTFVSERPRRIDGSVCRPNDTSGCAIGGPIANVGTPNFSAGFSTGKIDLLDSGEPLNVPVNPGGFAIYSGSGRVLGGVGISGLDPDQAEYVAAVTIARAGFALAPFDPIPFPGGVFIDGLRLPFFSDCLDVECVRARLNANPPLAGAGTFSAGDVTVQPRAGLAVPTGYLIGPSASPVAGGLGADEVRRIVDQSVARALVTRAQIRLPLTQPTRMVIAVSDEQGNLLAAFRMDDSTVFSFDVATAKARNAYYFSTREGYDVLRASVQRSGYSWEPEPPAGQGWAITNRTLSFGGQPLFPPGIDLEKTARGPWFDIFQYDSANPCTEGPGASRGANRAFSNQSGIVWFPGSAPLYKGGRLIGGVGVSGDGVEQDDYVTAAATVGFDAPEQLRADRSSIRTPDGLVRLPYWKFPRNPEFR
jgi:uncharacterized protein GlcG (DUF336 family)